MTIAAKITPTELVGQVTDRFVDQYFIVKLLNSEGMSYTPGVQEELAFVNNNALTPGTFGYNPQLFSYSAADVGNYADAGVGLLQKQCIFSHDGSNSQYSFTHCSVQWANGVILGISADPAALPLGVIPDGLYENLPVTSDGSGFGATVNLTVNNTLAGELAYSIVMNSPGFDYSLSDVVEISSATLAAVGAGDGSQGPIGLILETLFLPSNANDVFAIAPTDGLVTLANGNESAFYFNLRQFGYYNIGASES